MDGVPLAFRRKVRGRYLLDVTVIAAILVSAFLLTYVTGQRGFYPFDQSIVFDGSYRILEGQVPYKDFVLPFGPAAFWLQAFFFKVLGVTYLAYIVGAASVNVLAVLLATAIVRLLFPSSRLTSYVAGILTAVWFYPPFGTPWVDQTAFFFSFLALCSLLAGVLPEAYRSPSRKALLGLSGCFAFLAFISKQNVGSFMLPLYPLILIVTNTGDRKRFVRACLYFLAGLGGSAAVFLLWVRMGSDWDTFVRFFWHLPSDLGRERLSRFFRAWLGLLRPFFGGKGPVLPVLIAWGALGISLAALVRLLVGVRRGEPIPGEKLTPIVLCVYLVGFQHVFANTTLNQPENGLAFIGVMLAIALGLMLRIVGRGRLALKAVLTVGVMVILVFASMDGIKVSMSRTVHDIFRGAKFGDHLPVETLKCLRWAKPTRMGGYEITEEEVVSLYRYLEQRGKRFFVFPDFTILYGLLGAPPPQPLLWFHEGVTYRRDDNSDLDRWIAEDLKRNEVEIFVLEQVAWFNTVDRLKNFPQMSSYLRSEFVRVGQIGTFTIHEKTREKKGTAGLLKK
jgi:4-amino-4-deoxy-L-arabinose transferase-like glycosyltransferase